MGIFLLLLLFFLQEFPGSAIETGSWSRDILYFVLLDRFHNGDPGNDRGVNREDPFAFHGGDLEGVRQKLDYLQDLGVTTIWLSPVFRNRPMNFFTHSSYHGYWPWDFFSVDPRFGTLETLKSLAGDLHRRGMKLVLDIVVNHAGYDAPMANLYPDFFHQGGEIKDWNDRTQLETFKIFGLPDFASEKAVVQRFFQGLARFWEKAVEPDGFRLDAVKHVPNLFWKNFNQECAKRNGGNFLLLGELLEGDPGKIEEVFREGRFNSLFDYPLYYSMLDAIARGRDCRQLALRLYQDRDYAAPESLATFLDNHDVDRFLTSCGGNEARFRLALAFLFTIRGIPTLCYGDEVGLRGAQDEKPLNRGDMNFQGNPGLRQFVKELILLRKNIPALTKGKQIHLFADRQSMGFARLCEDSGVIALMNPSEEAKEVSFRLPFPAPTPTSMKTLLGSGSFVLGRAGVCLVRLPPLSFTLVSLAPECPDFFRNWVSGKRNGNEGWNQGKSRITIQISLPMPVTNEIVYLVGGIRELGNWNMAMAVETRMIRPGFHESVLEIPSDALFEYKYFIKSGDKIRWQDGENQFVDMTAARTLHFNCPKQ